METIPELRVSAKTVINKLGGAIANYLNETPQIIVLAMGNAAVNNAVKGIIIAQSFLASSALDFSLKVGFRNSTDSKDGREVTAIAFHLKRNW